MIVVDSPGAQLTGGSPSPTDRGAVGSGDGATSTAGGAQRQRRRGVANALYLVGVSAIFVVASAVVVNYALGSFVHDHDQRKLMAEAEGAIAHAAASRDGLHRQGLPRQPPTPGDALGILAIRAIGLQQAVVEGAAASQTIEGPGHVPGTAGLGQPGNSAVVGRGSAYGGPMSELHRLKRGDEIVTGTSQGESLYVVRTVRIVDLVTESSSGTASPAAESEGPRTPTASPGTRKSPSSRSNSERGLPVESMQSLYGPTSDNQLTLVTSASAAPWNTNRAVVVVARLRGSPYAATPQESRSPGQQGVTGDSQALPWLVLALLALALGFLGAVVIYRRCSVRSAYLLTTAPLLALTVIAAEACGRLLPAWS